MVITLRCLFSGLMVLVCCMPVASQKNFISDSLIRRAFISINPEDPAAFSKALDRKIVNKFILGFGEATHGTREFRTGFVRLAKDLVQHSGVNVILLAECGLSDSFYLNDFVVYGNECTQTFNRNQTVIDEDIQQLALWLRQFNSTRSEPDRVWLMGADILFPGSIAQDILILVKDLGISLSTDQRALLNELTFLNDEYRPDYFKRQKTETFYQTATSIARLIDQATSGKDLSFRQKIMVQGARNLKASLNWFDLWTKAYSFQSRNIRNVRDSSIFTNVEWIMSQKANAKVLFFAHNGHVEKDYGNTSIRMTVRLGHLLREKYPKQYYAIGTEAGAGSFSAGSRISNNKRRVGSILAKAGLKEGLLLFGSIPELDSSFQTKLNMTFGVSGPGHGNMARMKSVSAAFDAIYFVPTSSESTPLATRAPLEEFTIKYFFGDTSKRKFSERKMIHTKVQPIVVGEASSCDYQFVSISALFLDSKAEFAGFQSHALRPGVTQELLFSVPQNATSATISIAGRGIQQVVLRDFEIDQVAVNSLEGVLSKGPFHMTQSGNQVTIQRR